MIVYSKVSVPLKLVRGVYITVSSVGLLGVLLLLTLTVPPLIEFPKGREMAPMFGPSPPKASPSNTSTALFVLSSITVTMSSTAEGVSFTGVITIVSVALSIPPLPSLIA